MSHVVIPLIISLLVAISLIGLLKLAVPLLQGKWKKQRQLEIQKQNILFLVGETEHAATIIVHNVMYAIFHDTDGWEDL